MMHIDMDAFYVYIYDFDLSCTGGGGVYASTYPVAIRFVSFGLVGSSLQTQR